MRFLDIALFLIVGRSFRLLRAEVSKSSYFREQYYVLRKITESLNFHYLVRITVIVFPRMILVGFLGEFQQ